MTEQQSWKDLTARLAAVRDRVESRFGRKQPGAFGIESLEARQDQSMLDFVKAVLASAEPSKEDWLFVVEEVLCGRLANEKSLAGPAKLLHEQFAYQIFSRDSLAAMKQGELFQRFGFAPCGT